MQLQGIPGAFSVCKIDSLTQINPGNGFFFLGKTDEEVSLVCRTTDVPSETVARDDNWRCFRISGVLDFSLVGILSDIALILAEKKISIFAVSTYNTDYILVKKADYENTVAALTDAGYEFSGENGDNN